MASNGRLKNGRFASGNTFARSHGAPRGNQNAKGHGALARNTNAVKTGAVYAPLRKARCLTRDCEVARRN